MKKSMKKHNLKLQKSLADNVLDLAILVLIFAAIIILIILIKILLIYK